MLRITLLLLTCLTAPGLYGAGGKSMNIFVSIPPQKYLVERIGGEHVSVTIMVTPGHSPETYEPLPKQLVLLSRAQIYFPIGVPFENLWMDRIRSVNARMKIIDCCEEISDANLNGYHAGQHLDDPHVWTSPNNAKYLAGLIKDALVKEDPERQAAFEEGYQGLLKELDILDAGIKAVLQNRRTSYIIVSHPSWGYFAADYGIEQVSLESFGKERGPRRIAELIDIARREGIDTIFSQKQYQSGAVITLANELDAEIIEIDPLAENYIENLKLVANHIADATR